MGYWTKVRWEDQMVFDVELDQHHFKIDSDEEFGGQNAGPKPKGLVLAALAGCTGMDVVSILRKMRMSWDSFSVEIDAETADTHPMVYTKIEVRYILSGEQLDRSKVERAVALSRDKYCAVNAMLGKATEISHQIVLNPDNSPL
jgi:putative redox protein